MICFFRTLEPLSQIKYRVYVHTNNVSHRRDYVAGEIDYETVVPGVVQNVGFDSLTLLAALTARD